MVVTSLRERRGGSYLSEVCVPTRVRNPMWKDSYRQRQRRARTLHMEVRVPTRGKGTEGVKGSYESDEDCHES